MEKSKQTIDESVNKMKYLMGYDSSMTRIENQEFLFDDLTEDILKEQKDFLNNAIKPTAGEVVAGLGTRPIIGWPKYIRQLQGKVQTTPTEENPNCPNSIPYKDMARLMKRVAQVVRGMNTAFVRMAGSSERARFIYYSIKFLHGKNTYIQDFDECRPAIQAATEYFNGYFNDWFSKGETFEEEINQLIRRKYFRDDPMVQRYLTETIKILKQPSTETKPEETPGESQSDQQPDQQPDQTPAATTSGYKFVKGTSDDPYKYGTLGSGIAQVQQNLGVAQDGKWGPKTNAKMKELAPDYIDGYTNDDLLKVIQTIRTTKNPAPQKLSTNISPSVAEKTPMKLAPMAQQIQPTNQELKKLVRLKK